MNRYLSLLAIIGCIALASCAPKTLTTWSDPQYGADANPASGTHIRMPSEPAARAAVQEQYDYLTQTIRPTLDTWIERSKPYIGFARAEFAKRGMPEELAYLAYMESGYNPYAVSPSGATGMWQFMYMTARRFGLRHDRWLDERRDPYKATRAAADYLNILYNQFRDWHLALAAYNAGEGTVGRGMQATGATTFFQLARAIDPGTGKPVLRDETQNYVPRFLALVRIMHDRDNLGLQQVDMTAMPDVVELSVPPNTDLTRVANACGMPWRGFAAYNPQHIGSRTHPHEKTSIYVPSRAEAHARAGLRSSAATVADAAYTLPQGAPASAAVLQPRQAVAGQPGTPAAAMQPERLAAALRPTRPASSGGVPTPPFQPTMVKKMPTIPAMPTAAMAQSPAGRNVTQASIASGPARTSGRPDTAKLFARNEATPSTVRAQGAPSVAYTVQEGDTLYSLSRSFGVSVGQLQKANNISSPRAIRAGNTISIPLTTQHTPYGPMAEYRVQKGDTIYSIARRFNVSQHDIKRWNRLTKSNVIQPGDMLKVAMEE
ncbi:MAG: LysM peptidoglycan-binding domain-containing protein [Desulfovibrionaceae bacterium]